MILETRAVAPFFKNGFVLGCEEPGGVVIDPGDEVEQLLEAVDAATACSARHILLTHAHLDHITGVAAAKAALGVPVWLHKDDNFLYEGVVQQGMMFGLRVEPQPPVDHFYDAGPDAASSARYEVARAPHARPLPRRRVPGGQRRPADEGPTDRRILFVGDTLFAGSIGRTDLPGGDLETLLRSIRDVLFSFPDDTAVYSGHGEPTTIGREKRTNPFLR